jgi:hypothetical protein
MADPLSITASIIAVVQLTAKLTELCRYYRRGVKSASADFAKLEKEAISIEAILNTVKDQLEKRDDQGRPLYPTLAQGGVEDLDECRVALERMVKKLGDSKRSLRKLYWPLSNGPRELEEIIEVMTRKKQDLSLRLDIDNR